MKNPRVAPYTLPVTSAPQNTLRAAFKTGGHHYLYLIRGHYDRMQQIGVDNYGPVKTALWLASVDTEKGGQPDQPDPAVKRTYRLIHAPRGSNLYWEQPSVIAAYQASELSGDPQYAQFAERYLQDFLKLCVSAENGLFLWGNHLYYDVFTDKIVGFNGSYFETRPLPVAWDMFWNLSPAATERCIRTLATQYLLDPETGYFDRHASIKRTDPPPLEKAGTYPFLEAGGVYCESLTWVSAKTHHRDPTLISRALKVARYSFSTRSLQTGLLQNQSGPHKRWDYFGATTEVGLWANCLLRSADYSGEAEFVDMAREGVAAYLRHGFDKKKGRYYGQLNYLDGTPRKPERNVKDGPDTFYQPSEYAELWEPLFPTHNYPMSMAEACLSLWQITSDDLFREGAERWAAHIIQDMPANAGKGAYADQYGRCIHFLVRASHMLGNESYFKQAQQLATEAMTHLYNPKSGMFRSHPGEERCDVVDGIGLLFLAFIYLEHGKEYDLKGFSW